LWWRWRCEWRRWLVRKSISQLVYLHGSLWWDVTPTEWRRMDTRPMVVRSTGGGQAKLFGKRKQMLYRRLIVVTIVAFEAKQSRPHQARQQIVL
jgi:hypothetical protein